MKKILLIEDEQEIADLLSLHLSEPDYKLTHTMDGIRGLTMALQEAWDLILLDLTLPRCDGLDVCQQIRECNPTTPIILVSARSAESDRVRGLELGADDYITKPFGISELIARVNAIFRRCQVNQDTQDYSVISVGDIVLNPATHTVNIAGKPVHLTAREFELLQHFARAPGIVFKRRELLDKVWGYSHAGYLHTVNSHINRLRSKIEPDPANPRYISTVWGVGYKLTLSS